MKKHLSITLLLAFASIASAQETVQWASEVMYVTSQTAPLQYSAVQALHKPNKYPQGGESPNAWRPKNSDSDEYIVVKFEKGVKAQQIAIAETENPGAVSKVYAYDAKDNEYLLFELTPRSIPLESRLLNLFFEKTTYEIAYIRVDISGGAVDGFNSIDAIGISDSNLPISVLIDLAPNMNKNVKVEALSKNVNSPYVEHSPLLSPDGNRLYFSRKFHPDNMGGVEDGEDIWYSEKDPNTGEWLPAKNAGAPLNTPGPNFISSITQEADGTTLLLLGNQYQKKGRMTQGISMSRDNGKGGWEKPRNLIVENDYNYSNKADYFMNANNDVILLSSERDDTYGDRDIYVSFKLKHDAWSEPINLGSVINTADVEDSPFIAADNETMYFSSNGFSGYGGADIYVSKRLDDTWKNWSKPENMGKGINGPYDDVYFNVPSSGTIAYFTKGSIDENIDIYQFTKEEFFLDITDTTSVVEDVIVTVTGRVINSKTNQVIKSARVLIERIPDGVKLGETMTSDESGTYSFALNPGARFGFRAEAEGFLSLNENIDLNEIKSSKTITRDLFLTPIEKQAVISINNIFFDFDKAVLKTGSYAELERILTLLNGNKIQTIEISGYTDSTGEETYNLSLSKRRAKSVYNFFREKGIIESRLISKGYGESQPIAANDTKANRAKNRRVQFKIID